MSEASIPDLPATETGLRLAYWDPMGAGGAVAAALPRLGEGVVEFLEVTEADLGNAIPTGVCGLVVPDPDGNSQERSFATLERWLPRTTPSELADDEGREHFADRVCGYRQMRMLFRRGWTIADLVGFNVRERYRVIAHDPKKHKLIGRIVAKARDHERSVIESEIPELFLGALEKRVTRRKHLNVLSNIADFVRDRIDRGDLESLEAALESYAGARSPRSVPLTLLKQHVERLGIAGLRAQSYLYPDPEQLRMGPPA